MADNEMMNDLIIESREHLQSIEPDVLELENSGNDVDDDLINRIFRAVHSIKGGFGFFGKNNIVKLSHTMENVMSKVRDKEISVTGKMTDALLKGLDKLGLMLDDVEGSEEMEIDDEVNALAPFLNEAPDNNEAQESNKEEERKETDSPDKEDADFRKIASIHPEFSEDDVYKALEEGMSIYEVTIDTETDIKEKNRSFSELFTEWQKFGDILYTSPDKEILEKGEPRDFDTREVYVLFRTVLEPDLVSSGVGVDEEKILSLNMSLYREKLQNKEKESQKDDKKEQGKEGTVKKEKNSSNIEEALRVKVSVLNNLMNYAGELVLARNQLIQAVDNSIGSSGLYEDVLNTFKELLRSSDMDKETQNSLTAGFAKRLEEVCSTKISEIKGLSSIVQNIDTVTSVIQENIMKTRMQPVSVVFSKFPRLIRDLSKKVGKEIELKQVGQEVELDKSVIELISDPLTHIIRNSADHGIETPETRRDKGKPESGTIELKAYHEGGKVIIEVSDDGAGINVEKTKQKALESSLITDESAESMGIREAQMLVFRPGFSTASGINDVSGRGVGMDVVKSNIEKLGGTIDIESKQDVGTTIYMKLPLTLAIIPSLIVSAENRRFAIPQVGLEEVVRIRSGDITSMIDRIGDSEVMRLRGNLLPLISLADILGLSSTFIHPETGERAENNRSRWSDRRGAEKSDNDAVEEQRSSQGDRRRNVANALKIAILSIDRHLYGLVVDDVLESEEIVVKPLPSYLKGSRCYAGATIMGDGKVAMIIDSSGVAKAAELNFRQIDKAIEKNAKDTAIEESDKHLSKILLFSIGGPEQFAIELDNVARIEKRKVSEIEIMGGGDEYIQFNNKSMKLIRVESISPVNSDMADNNEILIIIPENSLERYGIVAGKVIDAVETDLSIDSDTVTGKGIKGSAIIEGKMTILIDPNEFSDKIQA